MDWIENLDGNIIVCDASGTVIYMNQKAIISYADDGGEKLIGRNLMECHKESSNQIIRKILDTGEKNVYTIEKKGIKKIIYQSPWFRDGKVQGIIEFSLEIPSEMPHFIRD